MRPANSQRTDISHMCTHCLGTDDVRELRVLPPAPRGGARYTVAADARARHSVPPSAPSWSGTLPPCPLAACTLALCSTPRVRHSDSRVSRAISPSGDRRRLRGCTRQMIRQRRPCRRLHAAYMLPPRPPLPRPPESRAARHLSCHCFASFSWAHLRAYFFLGVSGPGEECCTGGGRLLAHGPKAYLRKPTNLLASLCRHRLCRRRSRHRLCRRRSRHRLCRRRRCCSRQ